MNLKTELRTTYFWQTCPVCHLTVAPQTMRAVFEPWQDGYRVWGFVCIHHTHDSIKTAYQHSLRRAR